MCTQSMEDVCYECKRRIWAFWIANKRSSCLAVKCLIQNLTIQFPKMTVTMFTWEARYDSEVTPCVTTCGQSTVHISETLPEGFCQSIPYHCWDLKKKHVERVQQISFHHHLMCLVPKQLQLILFGLANTNYPIIILAFQPCLHWLVCVLERENADIVMKIRKVRSN